MIDIKVAIRGVSPAVDGPPLLSGCFSLPLIACRDLAAAGLIGGIVADWCDDLDDILVAGQWLDAGRCRWTLSHGRGRSLVHVGHPSQVNQAMCETAHAAGIGRIIIVDSEGRVSATRSPPGMRSLSGLLGTLRRRYSGAGLGVSRLDYEEAFEHLLRAVGDRFRAAAPSGRDLGRGVVMLLGSLGPGGAERQAALTATGLQRRGRWIPTVVCSVARGAGYDFHRSFLEQEGVRIVELAAPHPGMGDRRVREVLRRSRKFKHLGFHNIAHAILNYACNLADLHPTVVYAWMDYSNVLGGIAAHMVGTPAIVLAGRSMAPDNFTIFQPYMRPGYLALLRDCRPILTNNSAAGARDYERWLSLAPERIRVVRNGMVFPDMPSAELRASARRRWDIPDSAAVLGTIMRFSEEKRPGLWIDVATRVVESCPSATCVAFGSGVLLEDSRETVRRRGLAHRILLPGLTDDSWTALACMDLLLLSSRMEGLPNVLIEAQAMGVPVVSTGHGGMCETYEENRSGWTVASESGLAPLAIELLQSPERLRRSGSEGASFVRRRFGLERMIAETESVLVDALPGKQPDYHP